MSIILTDRDAGTLAIEVAQITPDGPSYAVPGSLPNDYCQWKARFTNTKGSSGRSRANLHGERKLRDSNGKIWTLAFDATISLDNGSPFTADDIDDFVTLTNSYFSSQNATCDFAMGVPRS